MIWAVQTICVPSGVGLSPATVTEKLSGALLLVKKPLADAIGVATPVCVQITDEIAVSWEPFDTGCEPMPGGKK